MYRPPGSNATQHFVSTEERRQTNHTEVSQRREHAQFQEVPDIESKDRCHQMHIINHIL